MEPTVEQSIETSSINRLITVIGRLNNKTSRGKQSATSSRFTQQLIEVDFLQDRLLDRTRRSPEGKFVTVEGADHSTVIRVLQSQQLKPYHVQRVQALEYEQAFCLLLYTKLLHLFSLCYAH